MIGEANPKLLHLKIVEVSKRMGEEVRLAKSNELLGSIVVVKDLGGKVCSKQPVYELLWASKH